VGAVLAAIFLKLFEEFDLVVLIVAVGIFYAIEAAATVALVVDDDVEGIKGVAHSPGVADIEVYFLDVGIVEGGSGSGGLEAVEVPVLVACDEAAFVVFAESDPGTELVFGDGVEAFYLVVFGNVEPVGSGHFIFGSDDGRGEERKGGAAQYGGTE